MDGPLTRLVWLPTNWLTHPVGPNDPRSACFPDPPKSNSAFAQQGGRRTEPSMRPGGSNSSQKRATRWFLPPARSLSRSEG